MSAPAEALSASTINIPSKRKRKNSQRALSDSEDISEREDARVADVLAKGATAGTESARKDRKRRRKKRRRHPVVPVVDGSDATRMPALQATGMSAPKLPRKRSRSSAAKRAMVPVAGPSTAAPRSNTSDIASSPTARSASPVAATQPLPMTLSLKGKGRATDADDGDVQADVSVLAAELAEMKAQLAAKDQALSNHRNLLSNLQTSLTCQICLDPLHKPYALAPCGHVACHSCLVSWFRAPPADAHPDDILPVLVRKKTCPHCRTVLRERPIEVWTVKDMVGSFFKSGLADPPMNPPAAPPPPNPAAPANERVDPWDGIFRKPLVMAAAGGGGGLFFPDPPAPVHVHEILGMHDAEDGGIFRCVDCGHEIWDGVCSSCARVYPGHNRQGLPWSDDEDEDEDDEEHGRWMEGVLFGGGRWGFGLGTDEDDEDEDEDEDDVDDVDDVDEGSADGARNAFLGWLEQHMPLRDGGGQEGEVDERNEDEGGDDGYESSFIDDEGAEDEGDAVPTYASLEQPVARAWDEGHENDDGEEDDDDASYVPSASVRRSRLVVNSDDDEDGVSEDDAGHSDSGLADAVAERERHLYGDDGSIPHVDVQSSSPLHFGSDGGSDIEPDAPYYGYGAVDEGSDSAASNDAAGEDYGYSYSDEECAHDYDEASGDEYEYGDAEW